MQRPLPLLALVTALCGGAPLATAADAPAVDCNNAVTQAEMNYCAGQDHQRADARLNELYASLMQGLAKEQQADVRNTQRAWLQYRDLQCDFEAAQYEGGSMQPLIHAGCLGNLTEQRNQILQYMLDQTNQ